jgi:hypothetical protein
MLGYDKKHWTIVLLISFGVVGLFSWIFWLAIPEDRETVNVDSTQVSDSVIEMPAYCHNVIPERYIRKCSYAKDIMVGDTAWVTFLNTDKSGNAWLYEKEYIWHEKKFSRVIRITRDSIGYVADLRFCENDRFSISNCSAEDLAAISFPIYCVITDFPQE